MELGYNIIKICAAILSIITILTIAVFIFTIISNNIFKNKSHGQKKHISRTYLNNHAHITNNKMSIGNRISFGDKINKEKSFGDIVLISRSIQDINRIMEDKIIDKISDTSNCNEENLISTIIFRD